jgi:septum formation inhibitor MinC
MTGDRDARIICRNLQAELLSIDGLCRVADTLKPKRWVVPSMRGVRMVLATTE